ncbi:MAG: N-6 DNA methylase [Chloroflexi bacterium]|nr:N-6 DNA methylase [Chloroflexota bacterium]
MSPVAGFTEYLHNVQSTLDTHHATEPSYYPALKQLVESLSDGLAATVLPKQIECGSPDFVVTKGQFIIGYIEAKDIGKSLDEIQKTAQLQRYLHSLPNLILTDFLEFRWYVNGECRLKTRLGTLAGDKIKHDKQGGEELSKLIADFLSFDATGAGTAKELARRMARLAHRICEGAEEALNKGVASDLLNGLYKAFQETLIPDLKVDAFASMYAQTITYGLFAARCETDNAAAFSRGTATSLIPKTNPFLRDLFYQITGPALDDEPYRWAVDELVQLLKKAEMAEIMKGFGKGSGKDDPVVYFYEDFLREYDKKLSKIRGVYYTPLPVVSYIVRSIDYLLKDRFKRPQGLADEQTYILDPATGTGTFLYAVINEIYESMAKQGQMGKWDGYVASHLLPRLFGFELIMASYVIAHLKLGLQLEDTGYQSQSRERLGVYLTNTLEEAVKSSEMLMAQFIVKEANAAAEIKKEKPIMVVLGNPPYSGHSANKGQWARKLVEGYKTVDGKPLGEKNPKWLQDDYVKFLAFGQWRIGLTGQGILGFITNHSYLDNPTFRGMRQSLMDTFDEIYILNLHGNIKKKEVAPNGGKDENVFDIQQGVAICLMVKYPKEKVDDAL